MADDENAKQSDPGWWSWIYRLFRRAGLSQKAAAWLLIVVLAGTAGFYVYRTLHPKEPPAAQTHVPEIAATQSGSGNTQQVIGTLTQDGGAGCTQNVGIGSNNVLNCEPQLPTMSSAQVDQVAAALAGAPRIRGKVIVSYETTSDANVQLADQLYLALVKANISASREGHYKTFGSTIDYPGLSIMYVKHSNVTLANAIETALLTAKVITQPLKPSDRDMQYQGDDLTFVIRNP